jgi:phosphoglucosamine mutase
MTRLFGTDGLRGEAGTYPLDPITVRTVGRSLANHLALRTDGRAPRIVTGRDTRQSGEWIESAIIAGALEAGAECQSAGVITTPGVAYLARSLPADAGVVITASHNPYLDNGIKIFAPSGRKLDDATERLIEADVKAQSSTASDDQRGTQGSEQVPLNELIETALIPQHAAPLRARYRDYLIGEVANALDLTSLKIVVDSANGAASDLAPDLFKGLGAQVIAINNSPNGRNINLNCGSLHIDGVQKKVLEEGADLGIAFDGDADRALFVDAKGQFIDGDAVLWVMAKSLHSKGLLPGNTVVATVMSNIGLEIALRSAGIDLVRADVGDKYVLEKLLETGASLGGEQSGHIIFPKLSFAGDGIITTLKLMGVMQESNERLESLTTGFTRYPQILVNVPVRVKPPFADVKEIARAARDAEVELGESGRLLLRYSGTEQLARVMIEGERQDVIEREANLLAAVIKEAIGAP